MWNEQIVFTEMFPPLCQRIKIQLKESDTVSEAWSNLDINSPSTKFPRSGILWSGHITLIFQQFLTMGTRVMMGITGSRKLIIRFLLTRISPDVWPRLCSLVRLHSRLQLHRRALDPQWRDGWGSKLQVRSTNDLIFIWNNVQWWLL